MSKFYPGDVVQFGPRGTVQYQVFNVGTDTVDIQSLKSGQNKYDVPNEKLSLIQGGQAQDRARQDALVEELNLPVTDEGTFKDENDHRESSYGKAILRALNVLGKHVYSGTAKNRPARKAKKLAKVARRQTRKAKN